MCQSYQIFESICHEHSLYCMRINCANPEVGIYKRKQENKNSTKKAINKTRKKTRTRTRKRSRKQELDQESDQEKLKKNIFS